VRPSKRNRCVAAARNLDQLTLTSILVHCKSINRCVIATGGVCVCDLANYTTL